MSAAPVSVVVPCYRCVDSIRRAVASVVAQTARPRELILVDDASGDGTLAALNAIRGELGADWVRVIALARNQGPSAARNAGWDAAVGEYVAFLDADDAWEARKIEIQLDFARKQPAYALIAHLHRLDDGAGAAAAPAAGDAPFTEIRFRSLLYRNWFHPSSVMVRRELKLRFPPEKRYGEDRQLWLDVAAQARIARIDLPLVRHFKPPYGASGLSAHLWAMETAELATFRDLYRQGRIGAPLAGVLLAWSFARFLRRLALVGLRRGLRAGRT